MHRPMICSLPRGSSIYHYFGVEEDYLTKHFAPLVKKGGQIAVAVPGLEKEFRDEVPADLVPYWLDNINFHSYDWWYDLCKTSDLIEVRECKKIRCCREAWQDWLLYDNDHARRNTNMMKTEGGNYVNLVSTIAVVN